jgi:alpha-ketoglutarate-dependent taurine dioxygenase
MNSFAYPKRSGTSAPLYTPQMLAQLREQGFVLLKTRDCDVSDFGGLMQQVCHRLTFDPAREYASKDVQKVDAGTAPVGLHIENGNTPLPPDVVAFLSAKSAAKGSQTTLCDGAAMLADLPDSLKMRFDKPFSMTRYLPKTIWQAYVAKAFDIDEINDVTWALLERFIKEIPSQSYSRSVDDGIEYRLMIPAVRRDNLAGVPAFANALLGPSYNYEAPDYRFANGDPIGLDLLAELRAIGERHTREIQWQDGDVAIIDNKRVMHGRREILVPLSERTLYIAMGLDIYQTLGAK